MKHVKRCVIQFFRLEINRFCARIKGDQLTLDVVACIHVILLTVIYSTNILEGFCTISSRYQELLSLPYCSHIKL
jgi:hypothetical protein